MSRLMDKRRPDGTFPFAYRDSASTDVRISIQRERDRIKGENRNVVNIPKPKVRAK